MSFSVIFATTYVVGDLEDLQLEVYNFQLLRLCSSVVVVIPCAKLIVEIQTLQQTSATCTFFFSFLFFFFCTSRPLGWPGGTYDTCPATTYNVPLHLVLFMHYADERLLPGALATPASLPSGKWGVLQPQTDRQTA